MVRFYLMLILIAVFMTSCRSGGSDGAELNTEKPGPEAALEETGVDLSARRQTETLKSMAVPEESHTSSEHTGSLLNAQGTTTLDRVSVPKGFTRVSQEEGSYGAFVRNYPLLPDGTQVHLYDGSLKSRQDGSLAVFALPVIEKGDVQQCADSVMRMYAEYFWEKGEYDKIQFHFVNGFLCDYTSYREGKRVKVDGNDVTWQNTGSPDDSYEAFENYLYVTFAYSSTLSMKEESKPADVKDVRIGDLFLRAGSPGHVVMVADVCEDGDGNRAFLLAQGYMPAQQFHLLKNPLHPDDPWYYVEEVSYPFVTPEHVFEEGAFVRPDYVP